MTKKQSQAKWKAANKDRVREYQAELMRKRYVRKPRGKMTMKQKLALADQRALKGMSQAERGVKPWELEGEQRSGGNPTTIRPETHGDISTRGERGGQG